MVSASSREERAARRIPPTSTRAMDMKSRFAQKFESVSTVGGNNFSKNTFFLSHFSKPRCSTRAGTACSRNGRERGAEILEKACQLRNAKTAAENSVVHKTSGAGDRVLGTDTKSLGSTTPAGLWRSFFAKYQSGVIGSCSLKNKIGSVWSSRCGRFYLSFSLRTDIFAGWYHEIHPIFSFVLRKKTTRCDRFLVERCYRYIKQLLCGWPFWLCAD